MALPKVRGRNTPVRAQAYSIGAPVGGLNARDSVAAMDKMDAVRLDNWFPSTSDVQLRLGYTVHASGLVDMVETLMTYSSATSNQMFAATSGGDIFDVTASGAVGAPEVTLLTNGRFQYVNYTTTADSYLRAVNGADKSIVYDGSAWHADG